MNPSSSIPVSTLPKHTRIAGTGSMLPPRCVSNADLAAELAQRGVETSDDWIVERTGIRTRHFVDAGMNASDLAVGAARQAMDAAGCQPSDIDLIVLATSTPDMVFPSTACIVQNKLGIVGCPAFDVQAVCAVLVEYGCLTVKEPGRYSIKTKLPGIGPARCYLIPPAIFDLDL